MGKARNPPPPHPPQLGGAVPCLDKGTQQEQYRNIYKSLRENQSVNRGDGKGKQSPFWPFHTAPWLVRQFQSKYQSWAWALQFFKINSILHTLWLFPASQKDFVGGGGGQAITAQ